MSSHEDDYWAVINLAEAERNGTWPYDQVGLCVCGHERSSHEHDAGQCGVAGMKHLCGCMTFLPPKDAR